MCGRPLFQWQGVTKHLLQHTLSHTLHLVSTVGQGDHPTPHQAQFQRCWMLICSFVSDLPEEPFMIIHGGHMLYCEPSYCPTWHQQKLRNLQIFLLMVWLSLVPLQSIPVHCIKCFECGLRCHRIIYSRPAKGALLQFNWRWVS